MEGVGSEDGRVAVAGRQAAELDLDLVGPKPGGVKNRSALRQLGHSRRRGGRGGAALVVECDPLDPPRAGDQRDSRQVAAGRTAGGAADGSIRRRPAAGVVGEEMLEDLAIHASKIRRLQPAVSAPAW